MFLNPNSPWSKGKIGTQTDLHANIHTHTHTHTHTHHTRVCGKWYERCRCSVTHRRRKAVFQAGEMESHGQWP